MKKDTDTRSSACSSFMEVIENINKLYNARLRAECVNMGIQTGYRQIISYLSREDGVPQLELVRLTNFKAPTISITLQKMEQDGYVTRKTDLFDQRSVRVYLTDKARELGAKLNERIKLLEEELLSEFTTEEIEAFGNVAERMYLSMLKNH